MQTTVRTEPGLAPCGKERFYFGVGVVLSVLLYCAYIISIVGIAYLAIGALVMLFLHGIAVGHIRGNGIRVSERQFPKVYAVTQQLCKELQIEWCPSIYIMQHGGLLNAFATRFLGQDYLCLYSDVVEIAYEQGEDALAFVIAHELAHVKFRHVLKRAIIAPAMLVPFFGAAYSRACEYSCDAAAAIVQPKGLELGLLMLAAGRRLSREVEASVYCEQAASEYDFWAWLAERLASHPNLPKRLARLRVNVPTVMSS